MRRAASATVAFYIAIITIFVGIISYVVGVRVVGIRPSTFIHFANTWLLIAIVCYLHEIFKTITGKKE